MRDLPDWRVEGAAPARQVSDSGVGKRARQSPISASSRAARTRPARGRLVKMWASGWASSWRSIWVDRGLDLLVEGPQDSDQRSGDVGLVGGVLAGGAAWCV